MTRSRTLTSILSSALAMLLALSVTMARGDSPRPAFVGLGDSIGEGVQSADANVLTQPNSYLNLIARQMNVPFPLPLIGTNPNASIFRVAGRPRLDPSVESLNLAVSGASAHSLLFDPANAASVAQINSETDLVLFPRLGTQVDIAQSLRGRDVVCWIGSNEVLGAVTSFDHLDASQLTPVANFTLDFTEIASRLDNAGAKVVFGTIPDVTQIGFLVDGSDLIRFLGTDFGLPAGSKTTIEAMFLIKLGLLSPTVLANPAYVLDPVEQQTITNRIIVLNNVITAVAGAHHMPVADIFSEFNSLAAQPPVFFGVPLTSRYLGGLLSLDGVHPSNIGHALIANAFISVFNDAYHRKIPLLDQSQLNAIFLADPFVDKNGNGRVAGRPGAGLLETLAPFLGVSGDTTELSALAPAAASGTSSFLDAYAALTGKDLRSATPAERGQAFGQLMGIQRSGQ